jgi:hypothetical protein
MTQFPTHPVANVCVTEPKTTSHESSGTKDIIEGTLLLRCPIFPSDPVANVCTAEPKTTSHESSGDKDASEFAKTTGTAAESDEVPDNKQTALKAKDTPADTTTGQNDTRDPEDPQTHPKNNPTDVDDTGDGPNEAQKLDGPGPKPLDEVAREHGGDAGVGGESSGSKAAADKGDEEDDDPNDPNAKSQSEGTGEQYVKSSGLQADGGDFDATKPGAGREADSKFQPHPTCLDVTHADAYTTRTPRRERCPHRKAGRQAPARPRRGYGEEEPGYQDQGEVAQTLNIVTTY